jgi:hypothetical protein
MRCTQTPGHDVLANSQLSPEPAWRIARGVDWAQQASDREDGSTTGGTKGCCHFSPKAIELLAEAGYQWSSAGRSTANCLSVRAGRDECNWAQAIGTWDRAERGPSSAPCSPACSMTTRSNGTNETLEASVDHRNGCASGHRVHREYVKGKIVDVKKGTTTTHVTIDVGGRRLKLPLPPAIRRGSFEDPSAHPRRKRHDH